MAVQIAIQNVNGKLSENPGPCRAKASRAVFEEI